VATSDRFSLRLQRAWMGRGPLAIALLPLSWLFMALTAIRRSSFALGWRLAERLDVPVIVVGNLIAGGAGKTPATLALVELLRRHGWQPGVVSRGHGRASSGIVAVEPGTPAAQCGDEPLLLRLRGGVPVFVGEGRVAAARALRRAHPEVDIVVCDDGLQHLRLARDVQVLVFDERGVGNGWRLPAGPLRDPLPARVPPRSLVLYNATAPSTPLPGHLARRTLGGAVRLERWWQGVASAAEPLTSLRGHRLLAVAGLAHPSRFFAMLRAAGLDIVEHPLPDHHDFTTLEWPVGTTDIVLTEKDAVKIRPERVAGMRVWVAALDFALPPAFEQELLALLPPRSTQPR
jgi:tetraacyldisaccharide 4'-kinase